MELTKTELLTLRAVLSELLLLLKEPIDDFKSVWEIRGKVVKEIKNLDSTPYLEFNIQGVTRVYLPPGNWEYQFKCWDNGELVGGRTAFRSDDKGFLIRPPEDSSVLTMGVVICKTN